MNEDLTLNLKILALKYLIKDTCELISNRKDYIKYYLRLHSFISLIKFSPYSKNYLDSFDLNNLIKSIKSDAKFELQFKPIEDLIYFKSKLLSNFKFIFDEIKSNIIIGDVYYKYKK